MKTLKLLGMITLSVLVFQACTGRNDSKAEADSANMVKDTSTKPFLRTDSTNVTPAHIEVDQHDAKFAVNALADGMTEVALGKLAQQKGTLAAVKDFGTMIVDDHNKIDQQLETLGQKLRIALPNALDNDGQKKVNELSALSGHDFDKAYVNAMIEGHQRATKAFEEAEKNVKDADLQPFAAKTILVIRKHLAAIEQIKKANSF